MTATPDSSAAVDLPAGPPRSLTRQTFRGVSWSFLGAVSQAVLQFIAIAVLSRLVTVEEFGTAAAATVVTGLAVTLSQLGVGAAVVQARRLHDEDVASVFLFATALGLLLGGVLIAV